MSKLHDNDCEGSTGLCCCAYRAEIATLATKLEAAEKDAARYRFFKSKFDTQGQRYALAIAFGCRYDHFEPAFDVAIDAAIDAELAKP